MTGAIKGKDVVLHSATIVRLWGWATLLRCLCAAVTREPITFLRVLYPALDPAVPGAPHPESSRGLAAGSIALVAESRT